MVRELDGPYRTAILLRYLPDLSPAEISARTGDPAGTVRSRVHRGLALLRERLDRGHDGDRRKWIGILLPLAGPESRPVERLNPIGSLVPGAETGNPQLADLSH